MQLIKYVLFGFLALTVSFCSFACTWKEEKASPLIATDAIEKIFAKSNDNRIEDDLIMYSWDDRELNRNVFRTATIQQVDKDCVIVVIMKSAESQPVPEFPNAERLFKQLALTRKSIAVQKNAHLDKRWHRDDVDPTVKKILMEAYEREMAPKGDDDEM